MVPSSQGSEGSNDKHPKEKVSYLAFDSSKPQGANYLRLFSCIIRYDFSPVKACLPWVHESKGEDLQIENKRCEVRRRRWSYRL